LLGILLIFLGGLLAFGDRTLFDSRVFADRAAESLADPRVASYAADHITDAVILADRDLTMVRPVIHATAEMVVQSGPFRAIARRGFRHGHQLLLTEAGRDVLLSVSDVGVVLRSTLATRPELADRIPDQVDAVVSPLKSDRLVEISSRLVRIGRSVSVYSQVIFWFGVALFLLAIVVAVDHRQAVFRSGVALAALALLVLIVIRYGGYAITAMVEDKALGGALAGVWDTFTLGLRHRVLALGTIGILMTAASTAVFEHVHLDAIARMLRRLLWETTEKRSLRLLRIVVLLAMGSLAILEPRTLASGLVFLLGGLALFVGFRELFRLILPPPPETGLGEKEEAAGSGRIIRYALAGAVALSVVVSAGYVITSKSTISSAARTVGASNGYPELVDRRLNEVVFPTSHNAMSSAKIDNWMFPNQERGVRAQLEYGIRGLLIDVYAGTRMGGAVKTDLGGMGIAKEKYVPMLGEAGVEAAIRIRDRMVGDKAGDRALYMCHGLCELGATPLVETLQEIREFLVMNPSEVIIIIIEDYVEPHEIERAFTESRLIDFVFRGEPRPPWPTLREMVLADERVLVLAENDSEGVEWYHPAFEVIQETPYHFAGPAEFSNEPNRGGTAGSLLLMNHWVSSAASSFPSDAEVVNAYDVLLARARACQQQRGMLPNLIAVDFHRTGDLLRVARTLNGIPESRD
jgi:hypothetical protein